LVPSGGQFTEWAASVRKIYDSGDKTAAMDIVLAGAYGRDYRRFTDVVLPAGAFDRAISDIDTYFQVELGAMQHWNITTEGLKNIRHPVLSMRGSETLPVFLEGADLLRQWIPEIDTVLIPRASHDLPGRNPAAVASGLVEFFTNKMLGGLAPGALRRVREYIDQHLTENPKADTLARIAKLSLGHFSRAFKQSTGDSPHQYIICKRVAAAKELLVQTSRALADIALDVGFADQSHFSRTYAAVTGETPSACRRRHR
jgi:AraC-like DNA-binding protein